MFAVTLDQFNVSLLPCYNIVKYVI